MFDPWKSFRRAFLATAVLGLFACQDEPSPLSPVDQGAPAFVEVNGVKLVTVAPGRELTLAGGEVEKWINKLTGGTLVTSNVQLVIGPGSMSNSAEVSIEFNNSSGLVEFEFGPSGLQFTPAAMLTISAANANLTGLDVNNLGIAGASDGVDNWQIIGGTYDPVTNTVTAPVAHFSRYALCVE